MFTGECFVAKVSDNSTLVINRGSDNDVELGQRFQIYILGDEVADPETGKSLGRLEIVKGTGRVVHVQPTMATITTDMKAPPNKTIRKFLKGSNLGTLIGSFYGPQEVEEILAASNLPFENPEAGDKARSI